MKPLPLTVQCGTCGRITTEFKSRLSSGRDPVRRCGLFGCPGHLAPISIAENYYTGEPIGDAVRAGRPSKP